MSSLRYLLQHQSVAEVTVNDVKTSVILPALYDTLVVVLVEVGEVKFLQLLGGRGTLVSEDVTRLLCHVQFTFILLDVLAGFFGER